MDIRPGPLRPLVLGLVVPALAVAALACSSNDGEFLGSTPVVPSPSPVLEATSTPTPVATTENAAPAPSGEATVMPAPTEPPLTGLPDVGVERVFGGLGFQAITGMHQDEEGHWYVVEQLGRVQRIDSETGAAAVWLDITGRVDDSGTEMGLLGFALDPDFGDSGHVYVNYTGGGQTVVARFTAAADRLTADPGSEQRLLTVAQPFSNHNGGQIAFGPDGFLYIGFGDGGSSDPASHGQNPDTLLGSVARIDVSGGGDDYVVPPDNPFVGEAGARGEVWAYGFRNPWRFSFDRATGDLWLADVGERAREEVNLVQRGGNYGWSVMEGFVCRGGGSGCATDGFLLPVFDYQTGSGGTCSITGGFIYRGTAIPELRGAYVFSDFCSGAIFALRALDGVLTEQEVIGATGLLVTTMAEGTDGELYAAGRDGSIVKLVP
jgi:glucose/arabinose dehydrogenase